MLKRKNKICKNCGLEKPIFSKGFCANCVPKKPIKKYSKQGLVKKKIKAENTKNLHEFMKIWWEKQNPKKCWACGCNLSSDFAVYMVDHLLPKSLHKESEFDEDNFFLCCLSCHSLKESGFPKPNHAEAILNYKIGIGL
jgi:5-methylcytosine-specific restriction endonuclease McrA